MRTCKGMALGVSPARQLEEMMMRYFQHRLTNEIREAFVNPDYAWYNEITEAEAKGKPRQRGFIHQPTNNRDDDLVDNIVEAGVQIGLSLLGGNDDSGGGFSGGGGSFGGGGSSADW